MIRDITIGQYYAADSIIHKLDPRVKLAGTMLYIISLFTADGPICYLLAVFALAAVIHLSTVPFKFMARGLKSIVIILLILGSSIMTLTTTPNALTDGLEKSLGFLKKVKIPVHEIAMTMSIALRFIPILIEETDKIMKAQTARGADFESGGFIKKAKAMVPLLVPLFISAFRRASDLAMAMEARCYHGDENRTKMKPLKYAAIDKKAYGCLLLYMVVMVVLAVLWK